MIFTTGLSSEDLKKDVSTLKGLFNGKAEGFAGFELDEKSKSAFEDYNTKLHKGGYELKELQNCFNELDDTQKTFGENLATSKVPADIKKIGDTSYIAGDGLAGLSSKLKLTGKAIVGLTAQIAKTMVVMFVITKLIEGVQYLWSLAPTKNHLKDWAMEARQAAEETKNAIPCYSSCYSFCPNTCSFLQILRIIGNACKSKIRLF